MKTKQSEVSAGVSKKPIINSAAKKLNVALIFLAISSASSAYSDTCPLVTNIHEVNGEYIVEDEGAWTVRVQTGISLDAMKKAGFQGANGVGPKTCYSGGEDRPCSTVSKLTCVYETSAGSVFNINASSSGKRYQPVGDWIRTDHKPTVGKYEANMYDYKCVSEKHMISVCSFNTFP